MKDIISKGKSIIDIEMAGLKAVKEGLGSEFKDAVKLCEDTLQNGGKIVFTGIGKSAHISRKIAATFMSTGSPSIFMYPVEAMHGDLGLLSEGKDLVVAVSYSGETDELLRVIPALKNLKCKILAVTGKPESRLGKLSDLVLPMPVPKEACPFNLAPTTSTTALLALGDAMAMVLMEMHAFTKTDYGKLHPAGAIGRSLTYKAKDVMKTFTVEPSVLESEVVGKGCRVVRQMLLTQSPIVIVKSADGTIKSMVECEDVARLSSKDDIESILKLPYIVFEDAYAVDVKAEMESNGRKYVIVVDGFKHFKGIISRDDLSTFKA